MPALATYLARHQVDEEEQLLGDGQHQRAQRGDVGLGGVGWKGTLVICSR